MQYWIDPVLHVIDATISWFERQNADHRSSLAEQLKRIIAALCRNGHSHRELFDDGNLVLAAYAPGNPEAAFDIRQHLQNIIIISAPFYLGDSDDGSVDLDAIDAKYHRQMCIHLWYFRSELNGWQGDALLLFALQTLNGASLADYCDFFDNTVIEVIGPYNFLAGLRVYLEQDRFPDPVYHESVLKSLSPVLSTDPFWAHYSSSGFLTAVRTMVDTYTSLDDPGHWKVLESALELLLCVLYMPTCEHNRVTEQNAGG